MSSSTGRPVLLDGEIPAPAGPGRARPGLPALPGEISRESLQCRDHSRRQTTTRRGIRNDAHVPAYDWRHGAVRLQQVARNHESNASVEQVAAAAQKANAARGIVLIAGQWRLTGTMVEMTIPGMPASAQADVKKMIGREE